MTHRAHALSILVLLQLGCAAPRLGRGPAEPHTPVPFTVTSTEWDVWIGETATEPCASPCEESLVPGPLVIGASERGSRSQHRERFTVEGPFRLSVGRWSHDGERTAGGVLLGLGLGGGAVTFLAWVIAGAHFISDDGFGVWVGAGGVLAGFWALPLSILGAALLAWNDHPTYDAAPDPELESERGPDARRSSLAGRRLERGTTRASLRLLPVVAPIEGGVSLGLVGSF